MSEELTTATRAVEDEARRLRWLEPVGGVAATALIVLALATLLAPPIAVWSMWGVLGLAMVSGGARLALIRSRRSAIRRAELADDQLRRSAVELEKRRRVLDELGEGLDVVLFVCDAEANVLFANHRGREIFRLDHPEGRPLTAVTLSTDLQDLALEAMSSNRTASAEVRLAGAGDLIVQARAWPERPTKERVFLTLYDVTQLRRLERVRRDFVANVSHELRTPMSTIRTMAETLQDEGADSELAEKFLAKIVSEVDRLTRITDDLLTLSAAEFAEAPQEKFDLAEVCSGVVTQMRPVAESKGIDLRFDAPHEAPFVGSAHQLTQVALNLLSNAIQYTQEGHVDFRLVAEGSHYLIEVEDTGVGISSDQLPRIFERFYRASKGRARTTGGTGLGLAIVRHIVEAHDGRVEARSEMNHGSVFTVTLPRR